MHFLKKSSKVLSTDITKLDGYDECINIIQNILYAEHETPEDITLLNYVEANGNQYIITDSIPYSEPWKIEIDWEPTKLGYDYNGIWGISSGDSNYEAWISGYNEYSRYKGIKPSPITIEQVRMTLTDEYTGSQFITSITDKDTRTYEVSSGSMNTPITIWKAASNYGQSKIYSVKIWINGILRQHLLPALKSYVAGFYDTISGKFYSSATDTSIIPSPETGLLYHFNNPSYTFSNTTIDTGIPQSDLTSGYTIITRVFPTDHRNYRGLFGYHNDNYSGITGLQYQDEIISYSHLNSEGNKVSSINMTPKQFPLANWNIFVVKFDGSKITCYVNKEEVGSVEEASFTPLNNIIIGRAYKNTDRYYAGRMSNFMIYNKALDDIELGKIYNYFDKIYTNEDPTHTQLKYIESTGTQYIDTGIAGDIVYGVEFAWTPTSAAVTYQSYLSSQLDNFTLAMTNTDIIQSYLRYRASEISKAIEISSEKENVLKILDNTITVNDTQYGTFEGTSVATNYYNIFIFSNSVKSRMSAMKFYYLKLYGSEKLILDLIPVKKSDGTICVYDRVSKQYFYNQGTGTFQ